jgi:hypothetical protein
MHKIEVLKVQTLAIRKPLWVDDSLVSFQSEHEQRETFSVFFINISRLYTQIIRKINY